MKIGKKLTGLLFAILLSTLFPTMLTAASVELTASMKSALDKTIATADSTVASKINMLYTELVTLQDQDQSLDESNKTIHLHNEESLSVLRKQINQIDADKVNQLELKLKETRDRYKPLFTLHNFLSNLVGSGSNGTKISIQLARQNIQTKVNELQAAKDIRAKTIKRVRETLANIDSVNAQIKAERSTAAISQKHISSEWDNFKQSIKKRDASLTKSSLTTVVAFSHQKVEHKQKINSYEHTISDLISKAKSQIPS
jgi:hypothetical protein